MGNKPAAEIAQETHDNTSINKIPLAELLPNFSLFHFWTSKSQISSVSSCRSNRPWSRVSRRRWNEKTLSNPLESAKTAWPVPCSESLFLPEFKIIESEFPFENLGRIAKGAFGKVYKIQNKEGQLFAMKVLLKTQILLGNAVQQVKDEVRIQQMLGHHPFIVKCVSCWQHRSKLFIVSEFVPGRELFHHLEELGKIPEFLAKEYVAEIALALDFLHNSGVIYRDLKLENLMLDNRGHLQLIDFGLSKWLKYGSRTNTMCGTIAYVAPEVLQGKPYGHSVDWWALGVITFCMILGEFPYACAINDNGTVKSLPHLECSPAAKDLIERLLVPESTERLRSLIALKRVAFFHKFDFEAAFNMTKDLTPFLKKTDIELSNQPSVPLY